MERTYEIMFDYVIGIDPGANGGLAAFNNYHTITLKNERELDGIINNFVKLQTLGKKPFAVIEVVQHNNRDFDIPGKFYGMQKLFKHFHLLEQAVKFMQIPYLPVHPATWQKEMKLKKKGKETDQERKNRYKQYAQWIFPKQKVTLWNSDALILAVYGSKMLGSHPEWFYKHLKSKKNDKT